MKLNETHCIGLRSWVESANEPQTDFPLQNLPYGIFRRDGEEPRGGVAIGDCILDLRAALKAGLFQGAAEEAAQLAVGPTLNALMAAAPALTSALRRSLSPDPFRGFHRPPTVDALSLTQNLQGNSSIEGALSAYERERRGVTEEMVMLNRKHSQEKILEIVQQRAPEGFSRGEDVISDQEIDDIHLNYKRTAGFDVSSVSNLARRLEVSP